MKIISKSTLSLFLVLLISVAVVVYWSLEDVPEAPVEPPIEPNDPRAKAIINLSDSIEQISWNPAIKGSFDNMIVDFNYLRDENIIDSNTYNDMQKMINISYSSSLQRGFHVWKSECNQSNYEDLKNELLTMYSKPECKANLSSAVSDIREYDKILGFQSKLGIYIQGEYDDKVYKELHDQIESFEKSSLNCSGVKSILRGYQNVLEWQRIYYEAIVTIDAFDSNGENHNVKRVMKEYFCGKESFSQYTVYYNKFKSYNSKYKFCQ